MIIIFDEEKSPFTVYMIPLHLASVIFGLFFRKTQTFHNLNKDWKHFTDRI